MESQRRCDLYLDQGGLGGYQLIQKSFLKRSITNALDGTGDHILWEDDGNTANSNEPGSSSMLMRMKAAKTKPPTWSYLARGTMMMNLKASEHFNLYLVTKHCLRLLYVIQYEICYEHFA